MYPKIRVMLLTKKQTWQFKASKRSCIKANKKAPNPEKLQM